jgi:hypothetical protein
MRAVTCGRTARPDELTDEQQRGYLGEPTVELELVDAEQVEVLAMQDKDAPRDDAEQPGGMSITQSAAGGLSMVMKFDESNEPKKNALLEEPACTAAESKEWPSPTLRPHR